MEEQTIGQRIAAKRKELAMSQIDLGEEMGVSRQSVSKWEADAAILAGAALSSAQSHRQELGRLDILNRSKYSKQVNFSGGDADFYSQAQSIAIGNISGSSQIELMLDCGFTTGLQMQKVLHTWTVQNGNI